MHRYKVRAEGWWKDEYVINGATADEAFDSYQDIINHHFEFLDFAIQDADVEEIDPEGDE